MAGLRALYVSALPREPGEAGICCYRNGHWIADFIHYIYDGEHGSVVLEDNTQMDRKNGTKTVIVEDNTQMNGTNGTKTVVLEDNVQMDGTHGD